MKKTSCRTGIKAEALCRRILRFKAYRILATRYKSRRGEVDIGALKRQCISMVKVKARATPHNAAEILQPRQRQRGEQTALDFLARHPHLNGHVVRFDLMLVSLRGWPAHIYDAWWPE